MTFPPQTLKISTNACSLKMLKRVTLFAFKQESVARAKPVVEFCMRATFFGAFLKSNAPTQWRLQLVANTRRVQNEQQQRPTRDVQVKTKVERVGHKNKSQRSCG